jgi:hypothetical protein
MLDLWGLVNLVAPVTAWSNRNHYSGGCWRENEVAQDDGWANRTLWNQDIKLSVEERF